eukprot:5357411-Pyramimonas_sp.AAC.1
MEMAFEERAKVCDVLEAMASWNSVVSDELKREGGAGQGHGRRGHVEGRAAHNVMDFEVRGLDASV